MWPFKKPEKEQSGPPAAKARPKATVDIKIYRAGEDRWYSLDEARKVEEQHG